MNNGILSFDAMKIGEDRIDEFKPLIASLLDCYARMTYASVYAIDVLKNELFHVAKNQMSLGGIVRQEKASQRVNYYERFSHPDDLLVAKAIIKDAASLCSELAEDGNCKCVLSYNMRVRDLRTNRWYSIFHQSTPLILDSHNECRIILCVDQMPVGDVRQNAMLRIGERVWCYDVLQCKWLQKELPPLNFIQKKVLYLAAQGYSMRQSAELMCLSTDAIKKIRKQIFKLLGVQSISQAINHAITLRL